MTTKISLFLNLKVGISKESFQKAIKEASRSTLRCYASSAERKHGLAHPNNAKAIPKNVEETKASQKAKFSPVRSRDTSSARISYKVSQQTGHVFTSKFMGDQGSLTSKNGRSEKTVDSHITVYDHNNTVSLSSVVSGNVPNPYKMDSKKSSSKYNMQGGQFCQGDKYISGDLHSHHHTRNSSSKGSKAE